MTALALREDQTQWDGNQLAVLHQGGIDQDVTEPELAAFLHECQRRKLDPFSRQIYLIGRYDRNKGRKVYSSQTSIDGFRLIARRAADRSGIDYSYEDTIWFDDKGGRHEVWLSPGTPAAAKVVVIRNGQRFDAVARYGAYVQTNRDGEPQGLWRSMADVLIAKCAEGLALRKAFPEDLGGIYTEEEMAQADNPQRVQATVEVVREQRAPDPADAAWLTGALELADELGFGACTKLWRKSAEMVHKGELAKPEAARLQDVLRKRMEELKAAETPAEAEVLEGQIVEDALDPDDPWMSAIEGLGTAEDAEALLDDVAAQMGRSELEPARGVRIEAAILARFPQSAGETEAAA
jgi:phage recombination protein Bet